MNVDGIRASSKKRRIGSSKSSVLSPHPRCRCTRTPTFRLLLHMQRSQRMLDRGRRKRSWTVRPTYNEEYVRASIGSHLLRRRCTRTRPLRLSLLLRRVSRMLMGGGRHYTVIKMKNRFKQVKCKPSPSFASLHEESTLLTSPPPAAR